MKDDEVKPFPRQANVVLRACMSGGGKVGEVSAGIRAQVRIGFSEVTGYKVVCFECCSAPDLQRQQVLEHSAPGLKLQATCLEVCL